MADNNNKSGTVPRVVRSGKVYKQMFDAEVRYEFDIVFTLFSLVMCTYYIHFCVCQEQSEMYWSWTNTYLGFGLEHVWSTASIVCLQVQLNKALDESKQKQEAKAKDSQKLPFRAPEGIPVVKTKEVLGAGMLTQRQQMWVEGFPNEPYLENPVVYK